jgi:hypothetical protein
MISLLFLIYNDIYHFDLFRPYLKHCNAYIHPKTKVVHPELEQYVISPLIPTEWGKYSIVEATLALLRVAYSNPENEWFVLLSYDAYPLYTFDELNTWLTTQRKSIFTFESIHMKFHKTSQWWMIKREDVKTILQHSASFARLHRNFIDLKMAAVDEIYFLSLLKHYSEDYEYSNFRCMYTSWIPNTIQKHPATLIRLLPSDEITIKLQNSFFFRKTLPNTLDKPIRPKKKLLFVYVGTESVQQYDKVIQSNEYDFILLISIPLHQVNPLLVQHSIQIHEIHYRFWRETVECIKQTVSLHAWKLVGFTSEAFDVNHIEMFSLNQKMYDVNHNQTLWITPSIPVSLKKIAFLFLTRNNVHYPDIWKQYFKGNEDKVNLYLHPKEIKGVDWLKDNIIQNRALTEWGYITEAYFSLLREAMKNPENTKFIVISESCLPLKNFQSLYDMLNKDDIRTSYIRFLPVSSYDAKERIQTQDGYQKFGKFVKHYARFCLSRYHVEKLFLHSSPSDLIFFNKMHVGDEFFLTLLHPQPNVDYIRNFEITYDNWEWVNVQKKEINKEIKQLYEAIEKGETEWTPCLNDIQQMKNKLIANPFSYTHVTEQTIQMALKMESFFWRKFPLDSNIRDFYPPLPSKPFRSTSVKKSKKYTHKNSRRKAGKKYSQNIYEHQTV